MMDILGIAKGELRLSSLHVLFCSDVLKFGCWIIKAWMLDHKQSSEFILEYQSKLSAEILKIIVER